MENTEAEYSNLIKNILKDIETIEKSNRVSNLNTIKSNLNLLDINYQMLQPFFIIVIHFIAEDGGKNHVSLKRIIYPMANLTNLFIDKELQLSNKIEIFLKEISKYPYFICPFADKINTSFLEGLDKAEVTVNTCFLKANLKGVCIYSKMYLEKFLNERFPLYNIKVTHFKNKKVCKFTLKFNNMDYLEII